MPLLYRQPCSPQSGNILHSFPRQQWTGSFDWLCVFSIPQQGFTCVHLFYPHLNLSKTFFPFPFNTAQSPEKHRGAVCWLRLYNASGGPSSILLTASKPHLAMELRSEHTWLPTTACMSRCVARALCCLGSTRQPKELTYATRCQQWLIHAVGNCCIPVNIRKTTGLYLTV
jgi:hypothetical protein